MRSMPRLLPLAAALLALPLVHCTADAGVGDGSDDTASDSEEIVLATGAHTRTFGPYTVTAYGPINGRPLPYFEAEAPSGVDCKGPTTCAGVRMTTCIERRKTDGHWGGPRCDDQTIPWDTSGHSVANFAFYGAAQIGGVFRGCVTAVTPRRVLPEVCSSPIRLVRGEYRGKIAK